MLLAIIIDVVAGAVPMGDGSKLLLQFIALVLGLTTKKIRWG